MGEGAAKSYLNKNFIKNHNYLFISYTHTDKEAIVEPVLNKLYDEGVNYWYDTELKTGDDWYEEVRQVIDNECCVGAVIFLGEESILKNTIYEEVKLLNARVQKGGFKIAVVFIGYESDKDYLSDYFKKKAEKQEYDVSDVQAFSELFKDGRRLYLNAGSDSFIGDIVKFSVERDANEKEVSFKGNFERWDKIVKRVDGYYCNLGEYDYGNTKKPVLWKLIDNRKDGKLLFATCRAVDFVKVNDIDKYIVRPLYKELEKYPGFIRAGVICEDYLYKYAERLGECLPEDEADLNRKDQPLRLYFVGGGSGMDFYELYNSLNVKISEGQYRQVCEFIRNNYKCGVRLFMEFDDKLIG